MSELYLINEKDFFNILVMPNYNLFIELVLGNFSGKYEYVYAVCNLKTLLGGLEKFIGSNDMEFELSDTDSDSYIKFRKMKYGHLDVIGQLGSKFNELYICFSFEGDNTIIFELVDRIKHSLLSV